MNVTTLQIADYVLSDQCEQWYVKEVDDPYGTHGRDTDSYQ